MPRPPPPSPSTNHCPVILVLLLFFVLFAVLVLQPLLILQVFQLETVSKVAGIYLYEEGQDTTSSHLTHTL